jgi:hypothetical protein
VALVAAGAERNRQLLVHRCFDRDPDLRVDQLAQRDRGLLMQPLGLPDTLRHGAFLRRSPCRAAGWWLNIPPEECAISLFPHQSGHHRPMFEICVLRDDAAKLWRVGGVEKPAD